MVVEVRGLVVFVESMLVEVGEGLVVVTSAAAVMVGEVKEVVVVVDRVGVELGDEVVMKVVAALVTLTFTTANTVCTCPDVSTPNTSHLYFPSDCILGLWIWEGMRENEGET